MKKPRFSLGSIVMLLATLFVVIGMAAFLTLIAGDGVYERTRAVFGLLADQTEEATATPTGVPTASPMPEITEGPTPSPSPTATPALEPKRLTIAAAGTIYAPKTVRESVQEGTDHYDFMTTFEGLSGALENADLSIVTLETLAAGREKGYGNYNTTPQILDALRAVGVNFVSLATERALDKGYDGLDITASELTSRSIGFAGVYPDGTNTGAAMANIDGVQVAVLAYTYGLSDEGRERTRDDSRGVVAMMDSQRVVRDITQARVDGANIVVVLPHWGTKNRAQTPDTVQTMAREMAQAGADVETYQAALAELDEAATAMRAKVVEVNCAYEAAREAGDEAAMAQLRETGRTLTSRNLEAFRYAQKHLLGLMYERPIVPHEAPQETITLCEAIIDCLKDGDPATAVDEYAWTVNNVLEWYAMYFSPEVIAVQDDMNWGADNQDNLYWGTDINFDKADVDAATRSLYVRYDDKGGDFTEEIAIYEKAIETEKAKLAAKAQAEAEAMAGLAELLK